METLKKNLKEHLGLSDSNIVELENGGLEVHIDGYKVIVDKNGKVTLEGESDIGTGEDPSTESKWDSVAQVNTPNLKDNTMTAVYWKENGEEVEGDTGESWYKYVAGDNNADSRTSKWANAKTSDGSYFVWIPRYEYKILSGEGTSTTGKIEVKFIPTTQTTPDAGYKIHPAFTNGSSNKFKNGEWDRELAGIWVGKYESSREDATIDSQGSSETLKVLPSVQSWRNITIGAMYDIAYGYDREKESHLMKNSEWGAVAYLAHSQYGRNGNEITINNNSNCVTGIAGDTVSTNTYNTATTNTYNTEKGVLASSTGNIYGIYDLSGGAWEYVASYITNGNGNLQKGRSFVAKTTADAEGYKLLSTKYATVYPYNSSDDSYTGNYMAYKNAGYGYGDAVLETSASGRGSTSWLGDFSNILYTSEPFFIRGGYCSHGASAGAFCFDRTTGVSYSDYSFRVVLCP